MKDKTFNTKPIKLALLLAGIGMAQASYAVDLVAIEGQWSPDGGTTQIPMWGFALDTTQDCNSLPTWGVGQQLTDTDLVAGGLTINLRNCLGEPVSIVIPGQPATSCNGGPCTPSTKLDGMGRTRATSFTTEASAGGGSVTYVWSTVREGSFLYQSGSQPGKQVQMGLYGALTTGTYSDAHEEVTLLYSEIDPELHSTPAAATPLGYHPRHYLVNGSTSQSFPAAGDTNHPTVLRFLNAGLGTHVPTLTGGQYMSLVAEDGNAYPYAKQQYSVDLAAGKAIDALWLPDLPGEYAIYDRRGNGMVATLTMAAGALQPIANDDSYPVNEDSVLNVAAIGVLGNDTDSLLAPLTVPPASASLVSSTSGGSLTLNPDGSFTYTPNPDFNGDDVFTYRANDGALESNVASVNITVNPVNDAPAAVNDAYDAVEGGMLNVAAPGLLVNDTDVDVGDILTVNTTPVVAATNGTLTLYADGSFDYTPTVPAPDTDSFTYEVCDDGAPVLCDTAVVDITIIAAVNTAPVAVEDSATVDRNSLANFINLTANDSDADSNLKDGLGNVAAGQITVTTGGTTSRGGTVSVVTNGVNYTPKRNFRGTDTFNYFVTDLDGAQSNEVIVRVNVVRP